MRLVSVGALFDAAAALFPTSGPEMRNLCKQLIGNWKRTFTRVKEERAKAGVWRTVRHVVVVVVI